VNGRIGIVGLLFAIVVVACSSAPAATTTETTDAGTGTGTAEVVSTLPDPTTAPTSEPDETPPPDGTLDTVDCTGLSARACLLPWPNDALTVADPSTPTGRRLALPASAMPRNVAGTPIAVDDQNRADGFSPGSAIALDLPGVSIEMSGLAPSTDIGASLDPEAPIVIFDTATGERVPYWAELDAQAPDDSGRLLMLRPAVSLREGHRHLVVVRTLADVTGVPLAAPAGWTGDVNMALLRSELDDAGLGDDVQMAWEFTVASAESLAGRALTMRGTAYGALGDSSPEFTVTETERRADGTSVVRGTYAVANFLSDDGSPGSTLLLDADGQPFRNPDQPDYQAQFLCVVSTTATLPTVVYGHGLLGSRQEALGLTSVVALGLANVCATDWIGMSTADLPNVAMILQDLGNFPQQADRMVQALLNFQMLGRLVNRADGFASAADFALADGSRSALLADGAVFVGNSQGGILGGAASALSSEWSRVVLGVPGINYSLLLTRSSNWPSFQSLFDTAYTDPADRVIAIQLAQLLWDRGENSGYVQHLTSDTFPGLDPKAVLLIEAFGDHQVANVSTAMLARTIDASIDVPSLAEGRSADIEPTWGIRPRVGTVNDGAVMATWDFGTPAPPTVNVPPAFPEHGQDPHGAGSNEPRVIQQAFSWLLEGVFVPCDGPCVSEVLTG
jgi:hypothetical protein